MFKVFIFNSKNISEAIEKGDLSLLRKHMTEELENQLKCHKIQIDDSPKDKNAKNDDSQTDIDLTHLPENVKLIICESIIYYAAQLGQVEIMNFLVKDCHAPIDIHIEDSHFLFSIIKNKAPLKTLQWLLEDNIYEKLGNQITKEHILAATGDITAFQNNMTNDGLGYSPQDYGYFSGCKHNPQLLELVNPLAHIGGTDTWKGLPYLWYMHIKSLDSTMLISLLKNIDFSIIKQHLHEFLINDILTMDNFSCFEYVFLIYKNLIELRPDFCDTDETFGENHANIIGIIMSLSARTEKCDRLNIRDIYDVFMKLIKRNPTKKFIMGQAELIKMLLALRLYESLALLFAHDITLMRYSDMIGNEARMDIADALLENQAFMAFEIFDNKTNKALLVDLNIQFPLQENKKLVTLLIEGKYFRLLKTIFNREHSHTFLTLDDSEYSINLLHLAKAKEWDLFIEIISATEALERSIPLNYGKPYSIEQYLAATNPVLLERCQTINTKLAQRDPRIKDPKLLDKMSVDEIVNLFKNTGKSIAKANKPTDPSNIIKKKSTATTASTVKSMMAIREAQEKNATAPVKSQKETEIGLKILAEIFAKNLMLQISQDQLSKIKLEFTGSVKELNELADIFKRNPCCNRLKLDRSNNGKLIIVETEKQLNIVFAASKLQSQLQDFANKTQKTSSNTTEIKFINQVKRPDIQQLNDNEIKSWHSFLSSAFCHAVLLNDSLHWECDEKSRYCFQLQLPTATPIKLSILAPNAKSTDRKNYLIDRQTLLNEIISRLEKHLDKENLGRIEYDQDVVRIYPSQTMVSQSSLMHENIYNYISHYCVEVDDRSDCNDQIVKKENPDTFEKEGEVKQPQQHEQLQQQAMSKSEENQKFIFEQITQLLQIIGESAVGKQYAFGLDMQIKRGKSCCITIASGHNRFGKAGSEQFLRGVAFVLNNFKENLVRIVEPSPPITPVTFIIDIQNDICKTILNNNAVCDRLQKEFNQTVELFNPEVKREEQPITMTESMLAPQSLDIKNTKDKTPIELRPAEAVMQTVQNLGSKALSNIDYHLKMITDIAKDMLNAQDAHDKYLLSLAYLLHAMRILATLGIKTAKNDKHQILFYNWRSVIRHAFSNLDCDQFKNTFDEFFSVLAGIVDNILKGKEENKLKLGLFFPAEFLISEKLLASLSKGIAPFIQLLNSYELQQQDKHTKKERFDELSTKLLKVVTNTNCKLLHQIDAILMLHMLIGELRAKKFNSNSNSRIIFGLLGHEHLKTPYEIFRKTLFALTAESKLDKFKLENCTPSNNVANIG